MFPCINPSIQGLNYSKAKSLFVKQLPVGQRYSAVFQIKVSNNTRKSHKILLSWTTIIPKFRFMNKNDLLQCFAVLSVVYGSQLRGKWLIKFVIILPLKLLNSPFIIFFTIDMWLKLKIVPDSWEWISFW